MGLRYAEQGGLVPQGISAEMIADKWGISREELDEFGARVCDFRCGRVRAERHRGPGRRRRETR